MKYKLLLLFIATLFTLSSCKNEDITCIMSINTQSIVDDIIVFWDYQTIEVSVEASTTKGSIIQVEIRVDEEEVIEFALVSPYNFTVPPNSMEAGLHTLTAVVYTSSGNRAVDAQYIKIQKAK